MDRLNRLMAGARICISKSSQAMFSSDSQALVQSIRTGAAIFMVACVLHGVGLRFTWWLLHGASPAAFSILAGAAATAAYLAWATWNLRLTRLCGVFLRALAPGAHEETVKHMVRYWRIVLADMAAYGVMELYFSTERPGGPHLWTLAWLALLALTLYASARTAWLVRCVVRQLDKPPADNDEYPYVASAKSPLFHRLGCKAASTISPPNFRVYTTEAEATADAKKPCWKCLPDGSKYYVASAKRPLFHKLGCEAVPTISPENLLVYDTEAEATADAKKPCWKCLPDKYRYIASTESRLFHKLGCLYAAAISWQGFRGYGTDAEAVADGKSPCWKCQPDKYGYVAFTNGNFFHKLDCPHAAVPAEDFTGYATEAEALRDGRIPCSYCQPGRHQQHTGQATSPVPPATSSRPVSASPQTSIPAGPTQTQARVGGKAPSWPSQKGQGNFVADARGRFFHKPRCACAAGIDTQHSVRYGTAAEAAADGKKPCWRCQPNQYRNRYIAFVGGGWFHRPTCEYLRGTSYWDDKDLVCYNTQAEGIADGKRKCACCDGSLGG